MDRAVVSISHPVVANAYWHNERLVRASN